MKALTLLAVVAIASLVSCTGLPTGTQAKLDQAAAQYEATTGITAVQTTTLLGQWWQDYQQAKELNIIQATKASPVTSTKDVIDVQPVTSFVAPEAPPPAPEPTEEQPKKRSRPSPRDPPRMLAIAPVTSHPIICEELLLRISH